MLQTLPQPTKTKESPAHSLLLQGNPVSVVKTFATKNCTMCEEIQFSNQIEPATSCQLQQRKLWCLQTQNTFPHACKADAPLTNESINDKRASLTHKVKTDFAGCNVCLADI